MSAGISLPPTAAWPLAARLSVASGDNPWVLLAVAGDRVETESEAFADELASVLDEPVERAHVGSAQELLRTVQTKQDCALVISGLDGLNADEWRRIDVNRSNLARTLPAVLLVDEARVPVILEHAPNPHPNEARGLRSHCHPGHEDLQAPAPVMSPEEILDLLIWGMRPRDADKTRA